MILGELVIISLVISLIISLIYAYICFDIKNGKAEYVFWFLMLWGVCAFFTFFIISILLALIEFGDHIWNLPV